MDVNLEALVGELGLITPARAAAPDDADGPGPEAQGEFDALMAALILLPTVPAAPVPSVWPGVFGPHVLDTVRKALPNLAVDIAPDTARVFELDAVMVPESDTVILPEPETVVPEPETVVPEPETAVVLTAETMTDIEPAPGVDVVLDAVRSVQVDAPVDVPALPEEDDEPSPRLDFSASAEGVAAPSVAARPALVVVTRATESLVVDAPKVESREVKSPIVESPEVASPEVASPEVESPKVKSLDVAPTALRSDAPRPPAADIITARRVVVTTVSDRPAEPSGAVVVKPAVRPDVSAGAPATDTPRAHGEPARLPSAPSARPAGAPAAVAALIVASERPMESVHTRPTPSAVTIAPDARVSRDGTAAVPITAVSGGVSGTPWHAAVADAPVAATPVAATPNILLRPTADDGLPLESRLVELVRWQAREGGGRVEMKLRPEFLGAMTVTVHVDGGVVKASLAAESQATRDFLQAEAGHLKSALEDQGFTLETFEVSDERDSREQEQPHQRPRQQPGPRRSARSVSGGTSFGETFDVVM